MSISTAASRDRRGADQDLSGLRGGDPARPATECPLCGQPFCERTATGAASQLAGFVMTEIDLLKRSSFAWVDLFGDDAALMANGFNAWGGIFFLDGRWHAVGGAKGEAPASARHRRAHGLPRRRRRLAERARDRRERLQDRRPGCSQPPTDRQLAYLPPEIRQDFGLTRYQASALITFRFNKRAIRGLVGRATPLPGRAA